jgi:hypothetical protein
VAVEEGHAEETTQEEEEDPLSGLMRAVRDPVLGFEVRDRSYHLKTYPACFVGLPPPPFARCTARQGASSSFVLFLDLKALRRWTGWCKTGVRAVVRRQCSSASAFVPRAYSSTSRTSPSPSSYLPPPTAKEAVLSCCCCSVMTDAVAVCGVCGM